MRGMIPHRSSRLSTSFKVGIGPSSSHTMGPMIAARRFFSTTLRASALLAGGIRAHLHGSLAFTGVGHATAAGIFGLRASFPQISTGTLGWRRRLARSPREGG